MPKKQRKFADDGWAVWIDGDDTSTVYINDWINPKGKKCTLEKDPDYQLASIAQLEELLKSI